jgi:hypothetical protein
MRIIGSRIGTQAIMTETEQPIDIKPPKPSNKIIGAAVEPELYAAIDADARRLRISLADAIRMRLRTGQVPSAA